MLYKRLEQFAEKNDWNINKNFAYGEIEGYLFTVADIQGFKVFLTPLLGIADEQKQCIIDFLNKNSLKFHQVIFDNDILTVKFREIFRSEKIEVMEGYLNNIVQFLKQNGIAKNKICSICGEEEADERAYIDFLYMDVHQKCIDKEICEIEKAAEQLDNESKNYFVGFIGAIFGGIISSIPCIILQIFFNKIAVLFAYIIGFGALKSYELFKGKFGPLTKWIIATAIVVSVIVDQFILIGIVFVKNGIPISVESFQHFFEVEELVNEFNKTLKISLFMALIAIIPIFIQLKWDVKNFLPKFQKEKC